MALRLINSPEVILGVCVWEAGGAYWGGDVRKNVMVVRAGSTVLQKLVIGEAPNVQLSRVLVEYFI